MSELIFMNRTYNSSFGWVVGSDSSQIIASADDEIKSPDGTTIDDWMIGISSFNVTFGSKNNDQKHAINKPLVILGGGVKNVNINASSLTFKPFLELSGTTGTPQPEIDAINEQDFLLTISIILTYHLNLYGI